MTDFNSRCNVCGDPLGMPLFDSGRDMALTSLSERRPGRNRVWACGGCGHLLGAPLPDTAEYYATDYRILLGHEDEDQIYEIRGDKVIYRTAHQAELLLRKLRLPEGAKLLDYGCAKASMAVALKGYRPDLDVHLFDVSEMYREHWARSVAADRTAVNELPIGWTGRFDVVTSFFALEHIPDPRHAVLRMSSLLRAGGSLYLVIPDTFGNPADLVVIDHVNHFTVPSLHRLLREADLGAIEIDTSGHRGALVAVARKGAAAAAAPNPASTIDRATLLARYWSGLGESLRKEEAQIPAEEQIAIYGSGFYGAWIASELNEPERVRCFLDRSPYQQGRMLFDRPIIAPERMPQDIDTVFVGLNPRIAREVLAEPPWPVNDRLRLVFLDGVST